MLLLYSHFSKKYLQFANFLPLGVGIWYLGVSIGIFFFAGRKCVDLVVIFNKGREETFTVFLQNRKSYVSIKYLTLLRPRKLIPVNFAFYTRCKMHRTPALPKNYSFHNFFKQIKLCLCLLLFKKRNSPQKMFMSCLCLHHGAYLNSKSIMFAYLLIIFGQDWFFLNK